jgi:hypothetical protein
VPKDINIDPDGLSHGGGSLQRLGAALYSGGGKLADAGQRLAQHASQDKSGVGKVLMEVMGRGTQIAGDVIKEGGRVVRTAGQHLHETGQSHRETDIRSKERFDKLHPDYKEPHPHGAGPDSQHPSGPLPRKTKRLEPFFEGEHIPGNRIWHPDHVDYLDEASRRDKMLHVRDGKLHDSDGMPFDTSGGRSLHSSGGRAIFVMDEQGNIYASNDHRRGRFHHSSFLAGGPVAGAGELRVVDGKLELISDQSGHYLPPRELTQQVVDRLRSLGVEVSDDQIEYHAPPA